ncbi:MAG: sugar kinase [cyanobacterium endosymbiont of Rhopalodia musculus]|uniref:sugar kinase n=1 Tax=cyanobacterium endosymbiont of Epithemia clementina EcSB TaxID=3034674 RepID=UPI002480952C|nr:sugar kinase [cyanobacterium endosymbiont of Epithemia clementina EcSB]WGT66883.1 sugar kinase [cyanobacterium endosymbiont of Epithemia clementina EcSB]
MNGLFIGLTTLDLIYLTDHFPHSNEKIVAIDETISAGGPATNAAITFRYFGNRATLLSVIGNHPISQLIYAELNEYSVKVFDLNPYQQNPLSTSSIIVNQTTGERAVVSINATKSTAIINNELFLEKLQDVDVILVDGHQISTSIMIAKEAQRLKIPVVLDGGSWKSGLPKVLPYVNYAICSDNFYPPNCLSSLDVFNYLKWFKIPYIAITKGANPVQYWTNEESGNIKVSKIKAVDTLGAGDIFHGAFCHFILKHNFKDSIAEASQVASIACQYFGTRQWMSKIVND